ncbi:hypothetical protein K474DRAFT_1677389 [Panus rudis PR-1116 ss-1]|nr:hypothetical protein K474DRAFT_1677389 [Panus rudis PR-1116 ss-1]
MRMGARWTVVAQTRFAGRPLDPCSGLAKTCSVIIQWSFTGILIVCEAVRDNGTSRVSQGFGIRIASLKRERTRRRSQIHLPRPGRLQARGRFGGSYHNFKISTKPRTLRSPICNLSSWESLIVNFSRDQGNSSEEKKKETHNVTLGGAREREGWSSEAGELHRSRNEFSTKPSRSHGPMAIICMVHGTAKYNLDVNAVFVFGLVHWQGGGE